MEIIQKSCGIEAKMADKIVHKLEWWCTSQSGGQNGMMATNPKNLMDKWHVGYKYKRLDG